MYLCSYLNNFANSPPNNGINPSPKAISKLVNDKFTSVWNIVFTPGTYTTTSSNPNPNNTE